MRTASKKEYPDDWTRFGDPWSIRREEESVLVRFADQTVRAVPYDMPVIGYGGTCINTLRLWQSEPVDCFDLSQFNSQNYTEASEKRTLAEAISAVLYPNDDTREGNACASNSSISLRVRRSRASCAITGARMGTISLSCRKALRSS